MNTNRLWKHGSQRHAATPGTNSIASAAQQLINSRYPSQTGAGHMITWATRRARDGSASLSDTVPSQSAGSRNDAAPQANNISIRPTPRSSKRISTMAPVDISYFERMNKRDSKAASDSSQASDSTTGIRSPGQQSRRLGASYLDFGSAGPWEQGEGSVGVADPELQPALQPATSTTRQRNLEFADDHVLPFSGFLELRSQEEEMLRAAQTIELPPLQSLIELTSAYKPPTKSLEAQPEVEATAETQTVTPVGRQMADGKGVLADGTVYEKVSWEEFGPNGFWKRLTRLKGASADQSVQFEEVWWEASDFSGLKELGATKSGNSALGGAWKETWCEKAYHDAQTYEMVIERTAHKWARADGQTNDEWEEKWGEVHKALGQVNKFADKWARQGPDVWHERWGEDYDGRGACTKWTDKWAERDLPGGAREQWGDKWTEQFGAGQGTKHGEVWSIGGGGERYNRWWNEHHLGNGNVRKWGNSTTGEYWDTTEAMDTYYNPIPHFGFHHAVRHSPGLFKIPVKPRRAGEPSDGNGSSTGGQQSQQPQEDLSGLGQGLSVLDMGGDPQDVFAAAQTSTPTGSTRQNTQSNTRAQEPSATFSAQQAAAPTPSSRGSSPAPSQPSSQPQQQQGVTLDWDAVLRSSRERSKTPPRDTKN